MTPRWPSVLLLVGVNLVPVGFLVRGDWQPGDVLVAYWLENVVVGAFAVGRIRTARGVPRPGEGTLRITSRRGGATTTRTTSSPVALAAFFALHFGLFTLVHGVFTALLAVSTGVSGDVGTWALFVAGLVVSHGWSYVAHWVRGGERDRTSPQRAMTAPYGRVVVLHVVVLAGFFLAFRGPADEGSAARQLLPALLLVALKTLVDVGAHLRSHRT